MFITKDGKVLGNDEVASVDSIVRLEEYFVVRVIRETGSVSKKLVAEFEFTEFPTDEQIIFCLKKSGGEMADVAKRYRI